MIKFLLISTSDGYVKFSHYFTHTEHEKRPSMESRVLGLCLHHKQESCHFIEDEDGMIIFRSFGPCTLIAVADLQENELVIYEFLALIVSLFQTYFGKFTEKHILFNVDRLHMVLEELVVNGEIVESSSKNALGPLLMLDSLSKL